MSGFGVNSIPFLFLNPSRLGQMSEMPHVRAESALTRPRTMHALPLVLALSIMSGCAPLTKSLAVMNGGGSGGSVCEFSGLFRGDNCADAMAHVYLSETWRDKPHVCGLLTTWGALGSKHAQSGLTCVEALPTYCKSNVLLPGFDNDAVKKEGAEFSATHAKKEMCDRAMTGQVRVEMVRREAANGRVVWSGAALTNEYGKETVFSGEVGPLDAYCPSNVLVQGVSDEQLKLHGAYDEAVKKKADLCKSEGSSAKKPVQK